MSEKRKLIYFIIILVVLHFIFGRFIFFEYETGTIIKPEWVTWSSDGERIIFIMEIQHDKDGYSFQPQYIVMWIPKIYMSVSEYHLASIKTDGSDFKIIKKNILPASAGPLRDVYIDTCEANNKIVYSLTYDGRKGRHLNRFGIWTISEDGSEWKHLKRPDVDYSFAENQHYIPYKTPIEKHPSWSPDGKHIVYVVAIDGKLDYENTIHVMNADGSDRHCISTQIGDRTPMWSPKGDKIAFHGTNASELEKKRKYEAATGLPYTGGFGLAPYLMNIDGSERQEMFFDGTIIDWSYDGTSLLYMGDWDLYVADLNTRERTKIGYQKSFRWSPKEDRLLSYISPRVYGTNSPDDMVAQPIVIPAQKDSFFKKYFRRYY